MYRAVPLKASVYLVTTDQTQFLKVLLSSPRQRPDCVYSKYFGHLSEFAKRHIQDYTLSSFIFSTCRCFSICRPGLDFDQDIGRCQAVYDHQRRGEEGGISNDPGSCQTVIIDETRVGQVDGGFDQIAFPHFIFAKAGQNISKCLFGLFSDAGRQLAVFIDADLAGDDEPAGTGRYPGRVAVLAKRFVYGGRVR